MILPELVGGGITTVTGIILGFVGITIIEGELRGYGPLSIRTPVDVRLVTIGLVLFVVGSTITGFGLELLRVVIQ